MDGETALLRTGFPLCRLLLNLSKAMLELQLLTRDHFDKWQHDKESTQVKVRDFRLALPACCALASN